MMAIHPTAKIHPSAIIEEGTIIGKNCEVGAFTIIGKNVEISNNVTIKNHVNVESYTFIGNDCILESCCQIGIVPNSRLYNTSSNYTKIGHRNIFYNYAVINAGENITEIGDDCVFMAATGVGHDTKIENSVTLYPTAVVNGNCMLYEHSSLGAGSILHQDCSMGTFSMMGAASYSSRNILPYSVIKENPARLSRANIVKMKSYDIPSKFILDINRIYKEVIAFNELKDKLNSKKDTHILFENVFNFISKHSERGFVI
jgi:UDP-N-acetylglucosamine acyltransferase